MAITTQDQIVAGFRPRESFRKTTGTMEAAGVHHSLWYAGGRPGAGAAPSSGINGAALSSTSAPVAGQIPWTDPGGGQKGYLARLAVQASINGTLLLCDRLWANSGLVVTTTTAQALTPAALPARDRDGTTNGADVLFAIEVSTATTNGAAITNTTMSYTDESGNAGNTGSIPSFPATAQPGTFVPFNLAAGDVGVRSVQSVTLGTSYGGGAIHLIGYRVLAELPVSAANIGNVADAISLGLPEMWPGSVPFLVWLANTTSSHDVSGSVQFANG